MPTWIALAAHQVHNHIQTTYNSLQHSPGKIKTKAIPQMHQAININ